MGLMKKPLLAAAAAAGFALAASSANALPFYGSFSVDANSGDGLIIETYAHNGGVLDFTLGSGTYTVDLFDIWTNESDVGRDDYAPRDISVGFDFTSPVLNGTSSGETSGDSLLGLLQWGSLTWVNPTDLVMSSGDILRVSLSNETFNEGLFGLFPGQRHGATVSATFEYVAVPEPATLALLGTGLLAIGVVRRKRRSASLS